jgi:sulfhydrogenase subunit gamma (sulfur reductase)
MDNNLLPKPAIITQIKKEDQQTLIATLKLVNNRDRDNFDFSPGQFLQLSIPGFGEAPFSLASDPHNRERLEILVKNVGSLTKRFFQAKINDQVGIRGPLGNGFPLKKLYSQNIVFISGGCGIAPMRSLIFTIKNDPDEFKKISFFYGSRTPQQLYFSPEYGEWQRLADLKLIVEKPDRNWTGPIGLVTDLLKKEQFTSQDQIIICGSPIMIKAVIKELSKQHLKKDNILLSLERRISCGVGACQHCVLGNKYICKDGPIFSLAEIQREEPEIFS